MMEKKTAARNQENENPLHLKMCAFGRVDMNTADIHP